MMQTATSFLFRARRPKHTATPSPRPNSRLFPTHLTVVDVRLRFTTSCNAYAVASFRYEMRSARSFSFFSPANTILVPACC